LPSLNLWHFIWIFPSNLEGIDVAAIDTGAMIWTSPVDSVPLGTRLGMPRQINHELEGACLAYGDRRTPSWWHGSAAVPVGVEERPAEVAGGGGASDLHGRQ
jgi:hypothetical protein